mmetsp:Transcript_120974/g.376039  ORF Transcript_120974/g.376039 Transcript_120974/m.376039 type:complete len:295 (+) Transcript_120974:64-948(+)
MPTRGPAQQTNPSSELLQYKEVDAAKNEEDGGRSWHAACIGVAAAVLCAAVAAAVLAWLTIGRQPQDLSLFCFALMLSDSYEVSLLRGQFELGAGIFGCDEQAVFSDAEVSLGSGSSGQVQVIPGPLRVGKDPRYNFALNTRVFLRVWDRVFAEGRFERCGWTVKADPDTVFLPGRLRQHLLQGPSPESAVSYVNCRLGLHGPLEVFSRAAVEALLPGLQRCRRERAAGLDTEGEDMFLARCMELLGVQQIQDFGLLSEEACMEQPFPCLSGKVAFHPLKEVGRYFQCLRQAER